MITNAIVILAATLCFATESEYGTNIRTSDNGNAVGAFQIWPIRVREINRIVGREIWTLDDRNNVQKSWAMILTDLDYRYKRGTTDVITLASLWRNPNGGAPLWHLKKLRRALHESTIQRTRPGQR